MQDLDEMYFYDFHKTNKQQEVKINMVKIYAHKTQPNAVIPHVAYGATSACFDITCTQTTIIPARGKAVVPNGLNLTIDQNDKYYMKVYLRSSKGFKYDLICHPGIIDPSYTGDLGIKIYNLCDFDVIIEEGERYAQIAVIEKPEFEIKELNDIEFDILQNSQIRGNKGFGSSGR